MKCLIQFLAISASLVCSAPAQTLAPEIAPFAGKYDADIKALDAARAAAVSRVQQNYLSDLDAAEKAATSSGKVAEVAAILKVRQAVASKSAVAAPEPGMSKALEKRHADYFSALVAVDREFAPRYEVKTADYLRSLSTVESRLPATSPARTQIDELKMKLLAASANGGSHVLSIKTFENTEWLWEANVGVIDPKKIWKFLRDGKIVQESGDRRFSVRVLGPDTFMISADGQDLWKFTMNFDTMEADGVHVSIPNDGKRLVFKGKISK